MNKMLIAVGAIALALQTAQADETLVSAGSAWKFLDDGSNQGTAWRGVGIDDSTWATGNAQLGYGDGDEATVVGFGGNTSNRYITTYFRKTFNVTNPLAFTGVTLNLLRDDGAIVYLNGVEVRRDNMPATAISYTTPASSALGAPAEGTFYPSTLPTTALVAGVNTIAVEVHQANATSSDLSFDLSLTGVESINVTRGAYLQLGTPTSMVVRWRTNVATIGRVAWGTNAEALNTFVDELTATTEHQIQLTGLSPNTQYYYSIGTPTSTLSAGADQTFFTAPVVGTVQPTRVWVLGDSGTADANAAAVRNAFTSFTGINYTDVWLMLGDNAYNNGTDSEYQAAIFNMYPSYLKQTPLWSTIGNHDTASSTNPALTIPYFQIHTLPANGEAGGVPSGTEKYYSFDYANIHFICLDSMTSSRSVNGTMGTWLENDLASTIQPWIIAFWHHPPYTKGSHNSDTETALVEMRTNMLPLLEAGGVDLVLAGHSHSYERSYLLNGHYGLSTTLTPAMKLDGGSGREDGTGDYSKPANNAANQGAVYITAGSSGKISGGSLNHPAMFTSLNNLGSLVLDVDGMRLDAKFIRENGAVVDYFTLTKSVPNTPPTVAITSPSQGATFIAPATIEIDVADNDPDGQVVQVDFYQGNTAIGTDNAAPFEFDWTDVPAGTYQLTATATDDLGATVTSDPIIVTVSAPPPPPDAPTGLTATGGNAQISLSWNASAGAERYTLYRTTQPGGSYAVLSGGLTVTSYVDATAANGTTYFYVVSASNANGESALSNEASATPMAPPTPPAAPSGLTAVAISKSQINIAWEDNSGNETGFKIERKQGNGGWSQIFVTGPNATSYSSTGLAGNKTYSYRVRATNSAGDSAYSNIATATTPRR